MGSGSSSQKETRKSVQRDKGDFDTKDIFLKIYFQRDGGHNNSPNPIQMVLRVKVIEANCTEFQTVEKSPKSKLETTLEFNKVGIIGQLYFFIFPRILYFLFLSGDNFFSQVNGRLFDGRGRADCCPSKQGTH